MRFRYLIRVVLSLALLLLFTAYLSGRMPLPLLDQLERYAYDARLRLGMPGSVDQRIVIVDVDDRSLRQIGQWPWPRDILAGMLNRLFDQYHVRMVAFDMTFPEADRSSDQLLLQRLQSGALRSDRGLQKQLRALEPGLEHDQIFADSLRRRPVVLGYVFAQRSNFGERQSEGQLPSPAVTGVAAQYPRMRFPRASTFIGNLPVLTEASAAQGFFSNPFVDPDGMFRRIGLLQEYRGNLYVSLDVAMLQQLQGGAGLHCIFDTQKPSEYDNRHLDAIGIGKYRVPVDHNMAALVPYRGYVRSFPYVSALDVIDGAAPATVLQNAIVYVGTSAAGEGDLRSTPVGAVFPGVEVHADFLSGVLDGRVMSAQPQYARGAEWLLLLVIGVILTWVCATRSIVWSSAVAVALLAALIVGNLLLWQHAHFVFPLAALLLFLIVLFMLQTLYGFFIEARGRRHLSHMFGQYIPPELVAKMDARTRRSALESDSRELSVLFSDVCGFTRISETLGPRELSRLMNEFLTPMTRVIHAQRGTIDKYMGDAIMAFWGAPLPDPEHARHALQAAFGMLEELARLNPLFHSRGWPPLHIGIGLNSGLMRVGDMGSEFRRAYTVMGDAVNLGERFQRLTREYGVDIVCGAAVRTALPEVAFLELDRVRVRGRDQTVAIYQPVGAHAALGPGLQSLLLRHEQALAAYRAGNWDQAEAAFFALSQSQPEKPLYSLYLDRIAYFRSHPPAADWDGVFSFDSK
ncbi:MAG: adenylate/guanylate cyclase domain-containing protein [Gammaproteobacteria bacterium]|nr:adenylate/guanylate cyclase domain-containing protein [Gammaproteobacteria bacterium]MDE1983958.1 adenylate/guanylate cyclase domain-containing protein [Gammaproteobacteria bacterium]